MKTPRNTMQAGYTLIETFVAITVLMIAVASPLVVAQQGINAALYARDQTIAYYLAQDYVEYLRKIRDSELLGNSISIWTGSINQCKNRDCAFLYTSGTSLPISTSCFDIVLYNDPDKNDPGDYTYSQTCDDVGDEYETITGFKRFFRLNDIQTAAGKREMEVEVTVQWEHGEVKVTDILYEIAPY